MASTLPRLAELVRLYRQARMLSQEQLAQCVRPRTNRSAVAHLEQALRVPPPHVLRGICTFLGIPEFLWLALTLPSTTAIAHQPISFLAIAGLMGSGKTTLGRRLAAALGMTYVSESSLGVRFLEDLSKDRSRWAFHTQTAFLCQKASALLAHLGRGARVLVDRSLYEDADVFARHFLACGDLDERSYAVYDSIAAHFLSLLPPPDAILFCKCDPDLAYSRIQQRSRTDTALHTREHVGQIHAAYEDWLSKYSSSTVLEVDSAVVDFRDAAVVQTIAAEIEQTLSALRPTAEQLDLFARPVPIADPATRSSIIGTRFHLARPRVQGEVRTSRDYPYPTAYMAAPFTSKASTNGRGPATLFPIGQPEGRIQRGRYRSGLVSLTRVLERLGFHVILPHRDVNRWGAVSLTSTEVMHACTAHVVASDLFVGVLGTSHGSHYEFGLARGQGKPTIVIQCREVTDSFIASGVISEPRTLVLSCTTLREAAAALESPAARAFLAANVPGYV